VNIEKRTVGDIPILTFAGEFDAVSSPATLEEIDGLIGESTRVVFNFRGLTFINSSALGYLIKTAKALEDQGGELVYSEPTKPFRNIVETYGVADRVNLFPNDQTAVDYFT
jgi:stage II sporulation protein AA (anti-sigma F factor antagonist)